MNETHPLPVASHESLIIGVSKLLHEDKHIEAGRLGAEFSKIPAKRIQTREEALEVLYSLLQWCLDNDHYDWAAGMLWGETLFTCKPRCTRLVWQEIKGSSSLLLQGAASMSKSYGCGGWLLLDWLRDPEYTTVNLVGPSEDHLKDNLFTHLVTLHRQSTLPLPGIIGDLFIGLDPKARKGAIRGVIIPQGKKPAGRLQGRKRVPRKTPHPKFGKLSRMRIFLDELEKIPLGVWKDIDNVFANLGSDVEGFKIIGAYNPEDITGQTAVRAEPDKGWEKLIPDEDEIWTSKRGWRVLRLDAAKCENVLEKHVVFEGLQTYEGYQRIIQNAGGTDTPGYWTMARACFPRSGAIHTVISQTTLHKLKAELIFAEEPDNVGGADLALEGGDAAEFAHGRFGRCTGAKYPPSLEFPQGREVFFTDKSGQRVLKWGLQLDQMFPLEPGDTVAMAKQIKSHAERLKIEPKFLMLDRTGNGAGVHDILKNIWSDEVGGVNYSEGASETKIMEEDTLTAVEEFERAVSELWFALKKWAEFGVLKILPAALSEDLKKELIGRRYAPGKTSRVETKTEYKSRANPSPNKADAATLLVHAARKGSGVIPSALSDVAGYSVGAPGPETEHRVCVTNTFDYLDGPVDDGYGGTFF